MSRMRLITAVAVLAALAACTAAAPPEVDQSAARYAALRDACLQTSPPRPSRCGGAKGPDRGV